MSVTTTIINNLIHNEQFSRKALPFIKNEYFQDQADKVLFDLVADYTNKYNSLPTLEALHIDLDKKEGISAEVFETVSSKITDSKLKEQSNLDYLVKITEDYCKDRAIYNGIIESVSILDGKTKDQRGVGAIPDILSEALAVSFDSQIGHDFLEDFDARYNFYHQKENRIPFDIEYLNKITKGGLPRKTLNVLMSSTTGGGKSLCMCHFAANNLMQGNNVLYITMEMAEEKIAERIDANLMDVTIDDLHQLPKDAFEKKAKRVKEKAKGRLVIKEYPTGTAHAGHFRHLLHELKIKKNFVPDVIYIDYLNICSSARVKMSGGVNSYTYIKTIAEELRGLAVEQNVVIVSATQGNRDALGSSDVDIGNISESVGLAATVDMLLAIITTEELEEMGHLLFKQLKNRYGPLDIFRRFLVGVERAKMRIFNVSETAQAGIQGNTSPAKNSPHSKDNEFFVKKNDGDRNHDKKFDKWE